MTTPEHLPVTLTVRQAAATLRVSARTIQRWIKAGTISARKINPTSSRNSPYLVDTNSIKRLLPK